MHSHTLWVVRIVAVLLWAIRIDAVPRQNNVESPTELAHEPDDRLLLFSTLDGNLHAIEKETGKVRWTMNDRPVVQVPVNTSDAITPLFLPDPRDGSLYLLGNNREPLKKLPFTVPQLVASSPCRSTDGILYTGKKKDTWFSLDPMTGQKYHILSWDNVSPTCPAPSPDAVYIGRTLYSIMMVDSRHNNRKWNVSFYDYAASPMSKDMLLAYNFAHFTSTSSGRLVTMDRRKGSLIWELDLLSPVVAAYILDSNGLLSLSSTAMGNTTLAHLSSHLLTHQESFQTQLSDMKLYPTVYIGEHLYGLYVLPSLVDQNLVKISPSEIGPLLLDGIGDPESPKLYSEFKAHGQNYGLPDGFYNIDPTLFQTLPGFEEYTIIFIGHYNVPEYSSSKLMIAGATNAHLRLLTDASSNTVKENILETPVLKNPSVGVQTDDEDDPVADAAAPESFDAFLFAKYAYESAETWLNQQDSKGLKLMVIVLVGCVIAMFWYLQMQVREFQQWSQNGSRGSQNGSFERNGSVTAMPEELEGGIVKIGKILFNPEELLGKGCEGTFVYKGEFDKRRVAVKRLLPECFNFADREVALLRESDAHPNVVRYYCTEQDRMFRYIALELCQATLHDYIQGRCDRSAITPLQILYQATSGLAHLHSLDIVHRDIKPQNVLLSVPNAKREVRAMISDFGLCKKLQVGRVSFSRRSGITGTDGWIAPEMLNNTNRTTCAVDLFSLGCLYYYVLSEGCHPFGDALRRQANILSGEYALDELKSAQWQVAVQRPLIAALISSRSQLRPSCNTVLAHPIFWSSNTILAFFQDVSDRVEKAEADDPILMKLEEGAERVVKRDWRYHIHDEVANDLRKYRSYRGESVRDLLRALRNKKHHYRELSSEAQETLGDIPDAFAAYWNSRFPLLLLHTWHAMQCVSPEKAFEQYYPSRYHFAQEIVTAELNSLIQFEDVDGLDQNPLFKESPKKVKYKYYKTAYRNNPRDGNVAAFRQRKRSDGNIVQENIGLYRNLRIGNEDGGKKENNTDRFVPKAKKKVCDEPIVWATHDILKD